MLAQSADESLLLEPLQTEDRTPMASTTRDGVGSGPHPQVKWLCGLVPAELFRATVQDPDFARPHCLATDANRSCHPEESQCVCELVRQWARARRPTLTALPANAEALGKARAQLLATTELTPVRRICWMPTILETVAAPDKTRG